MSSELKTVDVKKLVLQTLYKTINTRVHYNQQQWSARFHSGVASTEEIDQPLPRYSKYAWQLTSKLRFSKSHKSKLLSACICILNANLALDTNTGLAYIFTSTSEKSLDLCDLVPDTKSPLLGILPQGPKSLVSTANMSKTVSRSVACQWA